MRLSSIFPSETPRAPSSCRDARLLGVMVFMSGLLTAICSHADQRVLTPFEPCPQHDAPEQTQVKAQCATLTVPENRDAPGGRALVLPIVRFQASDKNPAAPVFILKGGPGDSNVTDKEPLAEVGRRHDVIYVGYRGADGSTVLQCPEINAHIDVPRILSSANLKALEEASGACVRRLQKSGIDLAHYTMLDVIDDLETARSALGHEQINLFSISYGTRVAQYYARRHPQRIFRSVMVGTNPPGHFVFSARVHDQILARLSQLCAADTHCASQTKNLQQTVLNALRAGEKSGNMRIDDGKTRLALFMSMYHRERFGMFAAAAIAAEGGDTSGLEKLGPIVTEAVKATIWGDLLSKGVLDSYRYSELQSTFATTAVSMGSPLDMLFQAVAKQWPNTPFPEQYHRAVRDETQTLIINGDIDIATPLTFVQNELMPHLPNGKLLVLKDYGHSDDGRQAGALGQIIAKYLASGQLDAAALRDDPYVFGSRM